MPLNTSQVFLEILLSATYMTSAKSDETEASETELQFKKDATNTKMQKY